MIRSDAQRRAMFASMSAPHYVSRDTDFALFDFGGMGSILGGFSNPLRIGTDILGDLVWGVPILTRRSPLESFIGDHTRKVPLTFEEMARLKIQ